MFQNAPLERIFNLLGVFQRVCQGFGGFALEGLKGWLLRVLHAFGSSIAAASPATPTTPLKTPFKTLKQGRSAPKKRKRTRGPEDLKTRGRKDQRTRRSPKPEDPGGVGRGEVLLKFSGRSSGNLLNLGLSVSGLGV